MQSIVSDAPAERRAQVDPTDEDHGPRYIVATPHAPNIVCPSWCVVDQEDHVSDLVNQEGFVIHWSADSRVTFATHAYPDGTPDPTSPPEVFVRGSMANGLSVERAAELAVELLSAVRMVQA